MLIWFPRIYFLLSSMLKTFVLVNITILLLIESQKEHNLFERDIFSNSVKASTFNLAEWKYYYKKIKEQKTYPKILNGRECHQKTLNIVWISLWYFLSFLELKSILCFTEERNLYITRWWVNDDRIIILQLIVPSDSWTATALTYRNTNAWWTSTRG